MGSNLASLANGAKQKKRATRVTLGCVNACKLLAVAEKIRQDRRNGTCELGFMPRLLVQISLPYRETKELVWQRVNGDLTVELVAHPNYGLPYGALPRLLLAWVEGQIQKHRSRELLTGPSLASFLRELGVSTGGEGRAAFVAQWERFARMGVAYTYRGDGRDLTYRLYPFKGEQRWWSPQAGGLDIFRARVILDQDYFSQVLACPVPHLTSALRELAREQSALAMDQYVWLVHRLSYLEGAVSVPWDTLELQFNAHRTTREFRREFAEKLRRVLVLYPEARVERVRKGLVLHPSPGHVPVAQRAGEGCKFSR